MVFNQTCHRHWYIFCMLSLFYDLVLSSFLNEFPSHRYRTIIKADKTIMWIYSWYTIVQSFSWAKRHVCCKSHVWTILRVRFARVSKPLNCSAITTKYHRNNLTFFKIRYIYTKGRNLTFKIVYSTGLVLKKIPKLKTNTKKPDKTDLPLWVAFSLS